MKKVYYGIDAPKVITNLIAIGLIIILITIMFPIIHIGQLTLLTSGFVWSGIALALTGILMVLYSKFGKFKHRDRILNKIEWKGDENVLDIGSGAGLLMIGAAKKLKSGKSIGIDIYDKKDLTKNTIERTRTNIKLEGVTKKAEILEEDVIKTDFPDDYFDVIISNLCLHNIKKSKDRKAACAEIYRILKPGGTVIISDFIKTGEYAKKFKSLGMRVQKEGPYFLDTFPPLTLVKASKKAE